MMLIRLLLIVFIFSITDVGATSIVKPKFPESFVLNSSYDVVEVEVINAVSVAGKDSDCFNSLAEVKILKSYKGQIEVGKKIQIGISKIIDVPNSGERFLFVLNKRSDKFYEWCDKPKDVDGFYLKELFVVNNSDFVKFIDSSDQKAEFSACKKDRNFLYELKYKHAQESRWIDKRGRECRKVVIDFVELRDFVKSDLNTIVQKEE